VAAVHLLEQLHQIELVRVLDGLAVLGTPMSIVRTSTGLPLAGMPTKSPVCSPVDEPATRGRRR
jgi:hypothetical protein